MEEEFKVVKGKKENLKDEVRKWSNNLKVEQAF